MEPIELVRQAYADKDAEVTTDGEVIFIASNTHEFYQALPATFVTDDPDALSRLLRKWDARIGKFPPKGSPPEVVAKATQDFIENSLKEQS